MHIERLKNLSRKSFLENFVLPRKPVIVTDAMTSWNARTLWTPEYLSQKLGDMEVQIYNDLFDLTDVATLREYFRLNFNRSENAPSPDYVRWFSKLKDFDFYWSDAAFHQLKEDWGTPYFLPENEYLIPRTEEKLAAETSRFPYRGLFISGRGARTRLHRDPWTTSAILCQFYGSKRLVMYSPDQAEYLMNGTKFVDVELPDLAVFPKFDQARVSYEDELRPGEVLFIPSGYFHHVETLTDSISVTWNFIHECGLDRLCDHLAQYPDDPELEVIRFFLQNQVSDQAGAREIITALKNSIESKAAASKILI